jgi:hypothetical protein
MSERLSDEMVAKIKEATQGKLEEAGKMQPAERRRYLERCVERFEEALRKVAEREGR